MRELADRLNPRACFDALYQRAEMCLRDEPGLRQIMPQARLLSSRRLRQQALYAEQEKEVNLIERYSPVLSLQQYMQSLEADAQSAAMQYWRSLGIHQPSQLTTHPMGTRVTGGNLMSAVLQAHSPKVVNQHGEHIVVTKIYQHIPDTYALNGGIYPLTTALKQAIGDLCQTLQWDAAPVVMPPEVFTGHLHDRDANGDSINREVGYLPPIHSAAVLLKRGRANDQHLGQQILLVWFATEYGLTEAVSSFIAQLDWRTSNSQVYDP